MKEKEELSLQEMTGEWLDSFVLGTVKTATYQSYSVVLNVLWRYVDPETKAADFTRRDLQQVLIRMVQDGLSKSCVTKMEQFLSRAYDEVLDVQLGTCRIPRGAKEQRIEALSAEEQKQVELACAKVTYGDLLLFLLDTGMRGSELMNLSWENFDGKGVWVRSGKTRESDRYIPLTNRAKGIISSQEKKRKNPADKIFLQKSGDPVTGQILKRAYCKVREMTGIQTFSVRVCRHSFATRLFEQGASPKVVSELMGHTSVAFTMQRYTSITAEALESGIKLIEQMT